MINVDLTEDQAKLLLILAGNCAGSLGSLGTFYMLFEKLSPLTDEIPEPLVKTIEPPFGGPKYQTFVVTQDQLDSIICD